MKVHVNGNLQSRKCQGHCTSKQRNADALVATSRGSRSALIAWPTASPAHLHRSQPQPFIVGAAKGAMAASRLKSQQQMVLDLGRKLSSVGRLPAGTSQSKYHVNVAMQLRWDLAKGSQRPQAALPEILCPLGSSFGKADKDIIPSVRPFVSKLRDSDNNRTQLTLVEHAFSSHLWALPQRSLASSPQEETP